MELLESLPVAIAKSPIHTSELHVTDFRILDHDPIIRWNYLPVY